MWLMSSPSRRTATRLATASFDRTIRLWDLTQADPSIDPISLRGHEEYVQHLVISNRRLATSSKDKPLRLWDLDADALVERVRAAVKAS